MCGSTVDIQSPTAENREEKERRRKKPQLQNIMGLASPQGGHKQKQPQIYTVNLG